MIAVCLVVSIKYTLRQCSCIVSNDMGITELSDTTTRVSINSFRKPHPERIL